MFLMMTMMMMKTASKLDLCNPSFVSFCARTNTCD